MRACSNFLLAVIGAVSLEAATITFSSNGTAADPTEFNSSGSPTIAIVQHPAWAPPLPGSNWVSFAPTGDPNAPGYTVPGNGTIISFFEVLSIAGPGNAQVTFRADDSTALFVNGNLVVPEAPPNSYTVCSDLPVGCLVVTTVTADIGAYLLPGDNLIQFDVAQRAGHSFGLNYAGTFTEDRDVPELPEPATLALIGVALAGLGLYRKVKKA